MQKKLGIAMEMAARIHAGQVRKDAGIPYVSHLVETCGIALRHGASEDEACGALLHDAVEDHGIGHLDEIKFRLGYAVADIVIGCSDCTPAEAGVDKGPWDERKIAYIAHLREASRSVLLVSASDKLSNATAIGRDLALHGKAVWKRFSAPKERQLWYYGELSKLFLERLPGNLANEVEEAVFLMDRLALIF